MPDPTNWIQAGGSVLAAWVGVGALLFDRHTRHREEALASQDVHAWVRWVDDDPDREVEDSWILFLSNGTSAPIQSWYVELSTAEALGSGDLGPLPPGSLRRRIHPSLEGDSQGKPKVVRLVFREGRGRVFERTGPDRLIRLDAWPSHAVDDDASDGDG
jgi:hypothetical protein